MNLPGREDVAPGVDGFLLDRGVDRALQGEVMGQGMLFIVYVREL
jgi:hypothetical protein